MGALPDAQGQGGKATESLFFFSVGWSHTAPQGPLQPPWEGSQAGWQAAGRFGISWHQDGFE